MGTSIRHLFLHGSMWTSCQFGVTTIVGIIQLVVSSRLLSPSDFGIYAISLFFFNLVSVAYSMGFSAALIQKKGNVDSYLNTVWTAGIIVASVFSLLTCLFIPSICCFYFHNTDATIVSIVVMCNGLFITFSNPGIIKYLKNISMKILFFYNVGPKLLGLIFTIFLLQIFKTYWALVFGLLIENAFKCLLSYIIHPYRPRFGINVKMFKELYSFSGWIQLKNIVSWLASNIDVAIVGNTLGSSSLGLYNRAQSLSNYPRSIINGVVDSVAFPLYAKISDDKDRLENLITDIQNIVMIFLALCAFCFVTFGQEIISLVLGNQWTSVNGPFKVICIGILLQTLLFSFNPILRAMGFAKQEFLFYTFKTGVLALLLYPFSLRWNLLGAGYAILLAVVISFPPYLFVIKRKTHLRLNRFISSFVWMIFYTFIFVHLYHYFPRFYWFFDILISIILFISLQIIVSFFCKRSPGRTLLKLFQRVE